LKWTARIRSSGGGKGERRGPAAGGGGDGGGAAIAAVRRSPEKSDRVLRGVVLRTETTGRERRARGTQSRPWRGRGEPARPAPWPAAMELAGARGNRP